MDIQAYLDAYSGDTKLVRLVHIGTTSKTLLPAAAKAAAQLARAEEITNPTAFNDAKKRLAHAAEAWPGGDIMGDIISGNNTKINQLASAISSAKEQGDEKTLATKTMELGEVYMRAGDLQQAIQNLTAARDLLGKQENSKQSSRASQLCMQACMESLNYQSLPQWISRVRSSVSEKEKKEYGKMRVCEGLLSLHKGELQSAASHFFSVPADMGSTFNRVISGADVATYGCLCALATYTREDLQKSLEKGDIKSFIELAPDVRDLVSAFLQSRNLEVCKLLKSLRSRLRLDIHLKSIYPKILDKIEVGALAQYTSPYFTLDMQQAATAFGYTMDELEKKLSTLIKEGKIAYRIDSHNKVLCCRDEDPQELTLSMALKTGASFLTETQTAIRHASMLRYGVAVEETLVWGRHSGSREGRERRGMAHGGGAGPHQGMWKKSPGPRF